MPTSLQFRRGTTSQNNSFTGSVGEISIDTDLDTIRIHDGSTAGGFALVQAAATQTLTNKTLTSPTINGATIAMSTNKITGLGDPTNAQDAATKAYIDSELSSLSSTTLTQGNSNVVVADTGTGAFTVTIDGSTHSTFAAAGITLAQGAFVGSLTGNASGSSGSCTGNAATATSAAALTTARAIELTGAVTGTANFDGSAAISIATTATADPTITLAGDLSGSATLTNLGNATLTATIAANSVALSTDTTGNYVAAGATSGSGISGSVSSEGGTFTVTSNATNAAHGNTIVFRDGSGDFSANVITATATTARYADLAEKYVSDKPAMAGTVMVFGGSKEVTPSQTAQDRKMAGVVSTDPAYLMNSSLDAENTVAIALQGRVPCKVQGFVRKGDMMVTGSLPGVAQAWREEGNPPYGSVIGKSLEDKDSRDVEVIEVAVGVR